jgi:hypothetical protein
MHAHVGMLRALNHHVERVFDQSRKDTHWGKRKLKRDKWRSNDPDGRQLLSATSPP